MSSLHKKMVGHGALILLVGMFAGVGLLLGLLGGVELWPGHIVALDLPGNPGAWARTHVGGMLNGMLIMLVALLLGPLGFDELRSRRMFWMLTGTGWANTLFYWAALFAPNRALTFGDNRFGPSNIAALVGLTPALVFVIVSIVAVVMLARQAFASARA
jgi:hypothetical protein